MINKKMILPSSKLDDVCIENIRTLCLEMIDKAHSGHPGMAMGSAPMLHTLFTRFLTIAPKNSKWANRDRFVLSSGHASALLYALLHLSGFDLSVDDLKQFRQLNSKTPGHPEIDITDGVDVSTGPLGQGVATAVGLAIGEEYMNKRYSKFVNHYTYCLCGDGDMQEGIFQEAASLAGHLKLNKLIVLYDSNKIQLDGETKETINENTKMRMRSMQWNYIEVLDGENVDMISDAIAKAQTSKKPTLIEIHTIIGKTTKNEGTNKVHGSPIPHEEVQARREKLGNNPFDIEKKVYQYYQKMVTKRGNEEFNNWNELEKPNKFSKFINREFKINFKKFNSYDKDAVNSGRNYSQEILLGISEQEYRVIGGAADLSCSVKTKLKGGIYSKKTRKEQNILYGVREHAMGAVANGLTLYGLKGVGSTFLAFMQYMIEDIRLAAISHLPTTFIFSHDSIAVGEDGPTHQPIEHLTQLRCMPGVNVIRPCDGNETIEAYKVIMNTKENPNVLITTRQNVKTNSKPKNDLSKGAYIISKEEKRIDGILIASGSEVSLAIDLKEELKKEGLDIRVVSMPSMFLFEKQSKEYQEKIIPLSVKRKMAIEMGDGTSYYKYIMPYGTVFGINQYGRSGKPQEVLDYFGFNIQNLKKKFMNL